MVVVVEAIVDDVDVPIIVVVNGTDEDVVNGTDVVAGTVVGTVVTIDVVGLIDVVVGRIDVVVGRIVDVVSGTQSIV